MLNYCICIFQYFSDPGTIKTCMLWLHLYRLIEQRADLSYKYDNYQIYDISDKI